MKLPFIKYLAALTLCALAGCLIANSSYAKTKEQSKQNTPEASASDTPEIIYKITGLNQEQRDNSLERLKIMRKQFGNQLEASEAEDLITETTKEIALALQPYGYFHPEITHTFELRTSTSLLTKQPKESWVIHYTVKLGPAVLIKQANIQLAGSGKNNAKLLALVKNNPLQINTNFTSKAYNATQSLLFNTANNQGYLEAKMTQHKIQINLEKNEATILLTLETGPRFHYGPVTFAKTPYDTNFLKRFINFNQADVYSPEALQDLQQDLTNTKYFSSVIISPDINHAKESNNDQVPITIKTQAVKSQQYKFGVGYGTNTGPRTSIGVDLFRITDTGQHLTALLNISEVATGITTKYFIPGKRPATSQYTVGAYIGQFKPDAGDSYINRLSTGYDTALGNYWYSSTNLNFQHEKFSIDDAPYKSADLIYPSFRFSRLKADNPINPNDGTSLVSETSFSAPATATDFVKSELGGKFICPTSAYNFLLLRAKIGALYARDYENKFPLSMRYFAGGIGSIRGYTFQSIGPGKYTKIASLEFEQKIAGNFYAGPFVDAGTASDNMNESLQRGLGLALVYRTSVGPINFNIAQANTDPNKPLSIQFSFGANL